MEEKSAEGFLGMTLEAVENSYDNYRVVAENGDHYMVTMDYDNSRINLELEDGIVIAAYWG